jgi:hypothetical protein
VAVFLAQSPFIQSDRVMLQPKKPWSYSAVPSIYGQTIISGVTFGSFGSTTCAPAERNVAISGIGRNGLHSDVWHPVILRNIELAGVEEDSKVHFVPTDPDWINQGGYLCIVKPSLYRGLMFLGGEQLIASIWIATDIGYPFLV